MVHFSASRGTVAVSTAGESLRFMANSALCAFIMTANQQLTSALTEQCLRGQGLGVSAGPTQSAGPRAAARGGEAGRRSYQKATGKDAREQGGHLYGAVHPFPEASRSLQPSLSLGFIQRVTPVSLCPRMRLSACFPGSYPGAGQIADGADPALPSGTCRQGNAATLTAEAQGCAPVGVPAPAVAEASWQASRLLTVSGALVRASGQEPPVTHRGPDSYPRLTQGLSSTLRTRLAHRGRPRGHLCHPPLPCAGLALQRLR